MFPRSWTRIAILAIATFLLSACIPTATEVTGTERDDVLKFAEPKMDAQLAALAADDYQAFIKDYDDLMKSETTEQTFEDLRALLNDKIGNYQSRTISSVAKQSIQNMEYYIVEYSAIFEKDNPVTMMITFESSGDHLIAGLYFNSAKLQQS